jgi:hypothetical protein
MKPMRVGGTHKQSSFNNGLTRKTDDELESTRRRISSLWRERILAQLVQLMVVISGYAGGS